MAFCQLSVSIISCDGLRREDLVVRVLLGSLVGLVGLGVLAGWRWTKSKGSRKRTDILVPASMLSFFLASVLDAAGRLNNATSTSSFPLFDRGAGAFAALSILTYLLFLMTIILPLTSPTSPYLILRPLRPLLLALLPLAAVLASGFSIASQTTLSYGRPSSASTSENPISVGFLTSQSFTSFKLLGHAEAGMILGLQGIAFLAMILRLVRHKVEGSELEETEGVVSMWMLSTMLGLVEVGLTFSKTTDVVLNVRRSLLFFQYLLNGMAAVRRCQGPCQQPILLTDSETTERSRPQLAFLSTSPYLSGPTHYHPAVSQAARRTEPLRLDLNIPNARSSWNSFRRPTAYVASRSSRSETGSGRAISSDGSLDTQTSSAWSRGRGGSQNPFLALRESRLQHVRQRSSSAEDQYPSDHSSFQQPPSIPTSSRAASLLDFTPSTAQTVPLRRSEASLTSISKLPSFPLPPNGILSNGERSNPFEAPSPSPEPLGRTISRYSNGTVIRFTMVGGYVETPEMTPGVDARSLAESGKIHGEFEESESRNRDTVVTFASTATDPFSLDAS